MLHHVIMIPLYGARSSGGKLLWVDGQSMFFVHVYLACFAFGKGRGLTSVCNFYLG